MKERNKGIFGMGMLLIIASVAVAFLVLSVAVTQPIIENETTMKMKERKWQALGDANLAGDDSGFMYFMTWQHNATPATDYAKNLSNASVYRYEYSDSLNTELTGETPYTQRFDMIAKFRVNDTVGYNTSSSAWEIDWVRGNMTCDFQYATDVGALQLMEIVEIANGTDFAWYHVYLQDADGGAGIGFQLTHGETFNITALVIQGNF